MTDRRHDRQTDRRTGAIAISPTFFESAGIKISLSLWSHKEKQHMIPADGPILRVLTPLAPFKLLYVDGWRICDKTGSTYARVFPEFCGDNPTKFHPPRIGFQAYACTILGAGKSSLRKALKYKETYYV